MYSWVDRCKANGIHHQREGFCQRLTKILGCKKIHPLVALVGAVSSTHGCGRLGAILSHDPSVKDYPFLLQPHLHTPVGDVMPPCIVSLVIVSKGTRRQQALKHKVRLHVRQADDFPQQPPCSPSNSASMREKPQRPSFKRVQVEQVCVCECVLVSVREWEWARGGT